MNEIKGGFPMGAIINGVCLAVEAEIHFNWDNLSADMQQEAIEFYAAFCMN